MEIPESLRLQLPETTIQQLLKFKLSQAAEVSWKALLGERLLGVQTVPGNHWTMFTPENAKAMTQALRKVVDVIEGLGQVNLTMLEYRFLG
jgi:hypothetical protein